VTDAGQSSPSKVMDCNIATVGACLPGHTTGVASTMEGPSSLKGVCGHNVRGRSTPSTVAWQSSSEVESEGKSGTSRGPSTVAGHGRRSRVRLRTDSMVERWSQQPARKRLGLEPRLLPDVRDEYGVEIAIPAEHGGDDLATEKPRDDTQGAPLAQDIAPTELDSQSPEAEMNVWARLRPRSRVIDLDSEESSEDKGGNACQECDVTSARNLGKRDENSRDSPMVPMLMPSPQGSNSSTATGPQEEQEEDDHDDVSGEERGEGYSNEVNFGMLSGMMQCGDCQLIVRDVPQCEYCGGVIGGRSVTNRHLSIARSNYDSSERYSGELRIGLKWSRTRRTRDAAGAQKMMQAPSPTLCVCVCVCEAPTSRGSLAQSQGHRTVAGPRKELLAWKYALESRDILMRRRPIYLC
jgi:hypothetical protein